MAMKSVSSPVTNLLIPAEFHALPDFRADNVKIAAIVVFPLIHVNEIGPVFGIIVIMEQLTSDKQILIDCLLKQSRLCEEVARMCVTEENAEEFWELALQCRESARKLQKGAARMASLASPTRWNSKPCIENALSLLPPTSTRSRSRFDN